MRNAITLAALAALAAVLAVPAFAPTAFAQGPAPATKAPKDQSSFFSAADLAAIEAKQPPGFSSRIMVGEKFSTAFIRLAKPDVPHAHGEWAEIFLIKEGSGEITTNGKITGITGTNSATHGDLFTDANGQKRAASPAPPPSTRRVVPGDLAGTGIDGGKVQKVGPGDVVLIPAGVAHWFSKVDSPIVYLDIKFPKED